MTLIEPYSYNVTYDDGSHASLATRERPKLIFDPTTKEPACVLRWNDAANTYMNIMYRLHNIYIYRLYNFTPTPLYRFKNALIVIVLM
jgi:hypothetical protein